MPRKDSTAFRKPRPKSKRRRMCRECGFLLTKEDRKTQRIFKATTQYCRDCILLGYDKSADVFREPPVRHSHEGDDDDWGWNEDDRVAPEPLEIFDENP